MKQFRQFLLEKDEILNTDDSLIVLLRIVANDHKERVLSFLDDLAVSDHNLRSKLDAYKQKAGRRNDNLPSSGPKSDMDEIVPASADGAGGDTEEDS